ncbi:hypothetical protein D3C81_2224790 [compost metagenome]
MPEHEDDGWDASAEEDVGRQADYGFEVVVLDQLFADDAFLSAPEQHAVRQDDGHDAVGLQVVQVVQ